MNIFETVKSSVTTRQAAERYGIRVNRNGMARCPFHDDLTPSMKVDRRFHCFGCQADGDVIDFVARLFDLPVKDAALKLADDFGIDGWDNGRDKAKWPVHPVRREPTKEEKQKALRKKAIRVYSDYLHMLNSRQEDLAPSPEDQEWNPLFVEAVQQQSHIEYVLDTLLDGTKEEMADMLTVIGPTLGEIQKKVSEKDPVGKGECHE